MRVHTEDFPHAATALEGAAFDVRRSAFDVRRSAFAVRRSVFGVRGSSDCVSRQFRACATAIAVRRLPTPAGPENSRLCWSESCWIDLDNSSTSRWWPRISRNGMARFELYHA